MYAGELMEVGCVEDIIPNPKHPYTQGLLSSFPSLKGEKKELRGIPGYLPDLSIKHEGCIFATRCKDVMDICRKIKPVKKIVDNKQEVSCHLYGGDD
jgi:peptide/nickel transport system ATP-binding protein